jgi:uncharacterized 2Fe-2S/4Fe-4S cluster protein (DUF4445 family)
MREAGMNPEKLRRICVCGAFGGYLNVANAQFIGLLPGTRETRVEMCGNAALAGCEAMLFSPDRLGLMRSLAAMTRHCNLSMDNDFERIFIDNLFLRPIKMDEP